ncbi:hypothetical protein WAI453_008618 [Rhynchosporium graminicola]
MSEEHCISAGSREVLLLTGKECVEIPEVESVLRSSNQRRDPAWKVVQSMPMIRHGRDEAWRARRHEFGVPGKGWIGGRKNGSISNPWWIAVGVGNVVTEDEVEAGAAVKPYIAPYDDLAAPLLIS